MKLRLRWLSGDGAPIAVAAAEAASPSSLGVVIVPSLGHEANVMQQATAQLARRLADHGARTVVVQLAGTDQSHGTLDTPHLVDHWQASVRRAVAELTALGVSRPFVVACRLGATLLDGAVDPCETSGIVLWSPTVSGRRHVRELRLLQAGAAYAGRRTDVVNVGGYAFPNGLLDNITALRADPAGLAEATRLLILDDDRRPFDPSLLEQLSKVPHVRHARINDIGDWLEADPDLSHEPRCSITTIAEWILDAHQQCNHPNIVSEQVGAPSTVVDGVEEEFVALGEGLAGVFHQGDPDRPALLVLSTSGPGRQFVELARSEARRGRTVLRFDLAGTGWSEPHGNGQAAFPYDVGAVDDVTRATRWLAQRTSGEIVAVGFCAGGHAVVEAAASAGYGHVVAFNVEMFEPLRSEPAAPRPHNSGRRVVALARKFWRGVGERRRTRSMLRRFSGSGADLRLIFDRSELSVRYLRTFRTGRAVLAGRDTNVSVRTLDSLGHNLEGPDATQAIAEVVDLLERLDGLDVAATRRTGAGAARFGRRLAAAMAIAAFDLAGGPVMSTTPDVEVAVEVAEADESVVRRSAYAHSARRRASGSGGSGGERPRRMDSGNQTRTHRRPPTPRPARATCGAGHRVSNCGRCRIDR